MTTFPVDDVVPCAEALPTRPLGELFEGALAIGGDPALPVLEPDGVHPLLSAVGRAFAEHRPLVLSPDAVWLTIAQGVAQHVRLHSEELRPLLVRHSGPKDIDVVFLGPRPSDPESWRHIIDEFHKQVGAELEDPGLFDCDFTTSTEVDRVAGRVVLLDAYSPYFSYWLTCVCGLPTITLTGTVADWQRIRDRVDVIAALGLEQWCRSLVPIMDQFVRAASGDVDTAFWKRIYNPAEAYGGDVITGWAARFYPYLQADGVIDHPNPLLDLKIDRPQIDHGIRSDSVPAALSRAHINIDKISRVSVQAGLVAITQDADGALRPIAGWHVVEAAVEMEDVIDRIVRDHETTPPTDARFHGGCRDVVALYDRVGTASLFGGGWRLLPKNKRTWVTLGQGNQSLVTLFELSDGRTLCSVSDHRSQTTSHWAVCRVEMVPGGLVLSSALLDDPDEVPVYEASLAMILEIALGSGGDIDRLRTGWLSEV